MTIKKLGHCCLLIRTGGLTILTDPGNFSTEQNTLTGVDVVLITHEHADHFHTESVQAIIKNNPDCQVITNSGVGKKLDELGISYTILEGRNASKVGAVAFEAFDCRHEEIFEEIGQVQNTAYMIDGRLFYPGDSYCIPEKSVEILALPVAGPWCRISEAIRYALAVRPAHAFPVHDGMLEPTRIGPAHSIPEKVLSEHGIHFVPMNAGDERDFSS
jgi:L-ascorbate metabolism protein UlaG (beta-lactamase superfamily)